MGKMKIKAVKPGMQLEQSIYQPGSDMCLLKAGTILSNRNVEQIKAIGIEFVDILDPDTILITPMDKMEESLVEDFIHVLREFSPLQPEAKKNDHVVEVAGQLALMGLINVGICRCGQHPCTDQIQDVPLPFFQLLKVCFLHFRSGDDRMMV